MKPFIFSYKRTAYIIVTCVREKDMSKSLEALNEMLFHFTSTLKLSKIYMPIKKVNRRRVRCLNLHSIF